MAPSMNGKGLAPHGTALGIDTAASANSSDENISTFWTRYESLKQNGAMMNYLLEDVLARYEHLSRKHTQYIEEHKEERDCASAILFRQKTNESNIQHLQSLLNSNPFVLVLIDAEDLIFSGIYLQQGEIGGRQIAAVLRHTISDWAITSIDDCPQDVKIVVRAVADVKSLADKCARFSIVDSTTKVEQFFRGFTYDEPLFDFVDVGPGRHRVIKKVIETFKLHLFDYHCRQILFGCGHDSEYFTLLEQFAYDVQAKPRITLLEGAQFDNKLALLPLEKKNIAGIFRDGRVVHEGQNRFSTVVQPRTDSRTLNGASGVFTPRSATPGSPSSAHDGSTTSSGTSLSLRATHVHRSAAIGPRTWSNIAHESAEKPYTDLVRSSTSDSKDSIKRNKYGQRIDLELEYDRELVHEVKKLKSCNQHYLGPGCCHYLAGKPEKCPHHHEYNLTAAQLRALRVVARETPCKKVHACGDPKCFYGHKCPFPAATEGSTRDGGCLNGTSCRFPRSMHGMDVVAVNIVRI